MPSIDAMTIPRRSKLEGVTEKTKEWAVDTGNSIMRRIAGDRRNAIFYSSVAVLCALIVAMFVIDKEEVDDLLISEEGDLIDWEMKGIIPPEDNLQPVPRDVNIVIIGDSVSRYAYLSLVYFLRWGRWFEPTLERSNLVNELSFHSLFHKNTFGEFFFQTSRMIQPYELCDCYKHHFFEEMGPDATDKTTFENRYYHDPTLNNTVTFLHAYGHQEKMHGRVNANEAYNFSKWDWHREEKLLVKYQWSKAEWEFDDWGEVVTEYIANLESKPEYVIVNAGQWENDFGPNGRETSKQFADALNKLKGVKKSIWKTTTYGKDGEILGAGDDALETDTHMCEILRNCFNVSWTKDVRDYLFWDDRHFFEPVYRAMNEEMLELLGYLPPGYAKLHKGTILKDYGPGSANEYEDAQGEAQEEKNEGEEDNDDERRDA